MIGTAAYYLSYFGVTLMAEGRMQILFHEAFLSLLKQPTLMVQCLSVLWVMEIATNPGLSIDRFIPRAGLCVPQRQHGNVMLQGTPHEGSSLDFLPQ